MGGLGGGEGLVIDCRTRLQFEGERTAVRTKGVNVAPRSPTGLISELEFGMFTRLQSGGRCVQEPPVQGLGWELWPRFVPRAEPLRSVCPSLLCPITEGPSWP